MRRYTYPTITFCHCDIEAYVFITHTVGDTGTVWHNVHCK